jgi:AraC family transcriptional regulator
MGIGEISLLQEGGALPTILAEGSAPGESGVSVLSMQFEGGVHFSASPRQHLIWFQLSDLRIECRRAARSARQRAPVGSLAICPAGIDCAADAEESANAIVVSVDPGHLSLAAAEDSILDVRLHERWLSFDQPLFDLARSLMLESARGYPDGALFWNAIANDFIAGLITRHSSEPDSEVRGRLGRAVLKRIRNYVLDHIDEHIDVIVLADIAGRSPFHFSRVFARSVGVTPHRYVVHIRLQRAVQLVREGRYALAEIAACSGFADQSHLSRWVRRVHGVSLTQLAA